MSRQAQLIGLDWGTSSLRAYLLGPGGAVLEARSRSWGIRSLPEGGFDAALSTVVADWPATPLIAAGMIGSNGGLKEAPYVELPANTRAIANSLVRVERGHQPPLHIVPGLRKADGMDVIRGEETQVMGAVALCPSLARKSLFILPGTHSKWTQVTGGKITDFSTYMTGELFAIIATHSILHVDSAADDAAPEEQQAAFLQGVQAVRDAGGAGASSQLFSTRALMLNGKLAGVLVPNYISGLLIGEEIRAAIAGGNINASTPLNMVGEADLCNRYRDAAKCFDLSIDATVEGGCARGLWEIASAADLIEPRATTTPRNAP